MEPLTQDAVVVDGDFPQDRILSLPDHLPSSSDESSDTETEASDKLTIEEQLQKYDETETPPRRLSSMDPPVTPKKPSHKTPKTTSHKTTKKTTHKTSKEPSHKTLNLSMFKQIALEITADDGKNLSTEEKKL